VNCRVADLAGGLHNCHAERVVRARVDVEPAAAWVAAGDARAPGSPRTQVANVRACITIMSHV
jgi:hypothetical protein